MNKILTVIIAMTMMAVVIPADYSYAEDYLTINDPQGQYKQQAFEPNRIEDIVFKQEVNGALRSDYAGNIYKVGEYNYLAGINNRGTIFKITSQAVERFAWVPDPATVYVHDLVFDGFGNMYVAISELISTNPTLRKNMIVKVSGFPRLRLGKPKPKPEKPIKVNRRQGQKKENTLTRFKSY